MDPRQRDRVRTVANWVGLSTPLGLAAARLGGAHVRRWDGGRWLATGYRPRFPIAPAFTVGDVVVLRDDPDKVAAERPALLVHERRHCGQWAWCTALGFLALYGLACGWSWIRTGDRWSRNVFESRAGLRDGGYPEAPLRKAFRRGSRRG